MSNHTPTGYRYAARSALYRLLSAAYGTRETSEMGHNTLVTDQDEQQNEYSRQVSGASPTYQSADAPDASRATEHRPAGASMGSGNPAAMEDNADQSENPDGSGGIDTEDYCNAVIGALSRTPGDESDQLVGELFVAKAFDAAERREIEETPEPLEGVPMSEAQRYCATGETDEEWLTTNYVISVGAER